MDSLMKDPRHPQFTPAGAPLLFVLLLLCSLPLLAACTLVDPAETPDPLHSAESAPLPSDHSAVPALRAEAHEVPAASSHPPAVLDPRVVAAHNRFGMHLFKSLLGEGGATPNNVFISPTSIALALGMVYNGAEGETAAAMREVMQLGELSRSEVNAASLALWEALDRPLPTKPEAPGVQIDIANSIWHRIDASLNETFLQENAHYFRALIEGLAFEAPESVGTINNWVSDATQGLIPTVVDRLDPDLLLLLINAVYFKGDWTTPFNPSQTVETPFHLAAGGVRTVPMMYRTGTIEYYEQEGTQAIRLPYGADGELAMYVFLPRVGADFGTWARGFAYESLEHTFERFAPRFGEVQMPRIDLAYKVKLNDTLHALGMSVAFHPGQADFSRMRLNDEVRNLYLGDVIHQSVLKVDEEGTEAAAVTSIEVRVTSLPVYDFRFKADRPFLIVIRDDVTEALLFVGAVTEPQG